MLAQKRSWPRGKQYDGLVTASSYCGLTSSCIERCSCCVRPPNGQLVGKLGLDIHSRRGLSFCFVLIESAAWKPQKTRRATDNFSCRAGIPFREEVFGDKGEEQHRLHCLFDTQRRPRKRHVWGTRQRRWCRPAPLLCETQPFCARGHIAQKRS